MSNFPVLSDMERQVRKILETKRLSFGARAVLVWMLQNRLTEVSVLDLCGIAGAGEREARAIVTELLAEGYLTPPANFDGINWGRTEK